MAKKPGILIFVSAFLCLAVPLSVFADVPTISGPGLSVSYDDAREKEVLSQPKKLIINSCMGVKLKIEELTPATSCPLFLGAINIKTRSIRGRLHNDRC